jgi:hypothetical protein
MTAGDLESTSSERQRMANSDRDINNGGILVKLTPGTLQGLVHQRSELECDQISWWGILTELT